MFSSGECSMTLRTYRGEAIFIYSRVGRLWESRLGKARPRGMRLRQMRYLISCITTHIQPYITGEFSMSFLYSRAREILFL